MTREQMLQHMPFYALGSLPPRQALRMAQALKDDPELVEELLFTLQLRAALRAWGAPLPDFSPIPARVPLPAVLTDTAYKVTGALRLAGSSLRMLGKLV